MVIVDQTAPADIVDRLGHHEEPDPNGNCVWYGWRRPAERAETAARRRARNAWTLRHDLNSARATPGQRVGNRGSFR